MAAKLLITASLGLATLSAPTAALAQGSCDCLPWEGRVVGHRGSGISSANNPYPENTLVSVDAAFTEGADAVEVDVQLSSDGVVVLMHDATVDATTDGTGCVADLSVSQLATLDAGGPNMLGMGVGVPTLAELLASPGDVNIELKVDEGGACPATDRAALAAAVAGEVAADPHASSREVRISSFDLDVLLAYRPLEASATLGLLGLATDDAATAAMEGLDGVHLLYIAIDQEAVDEAKAAGIDVHAWTVNESVRMNEMMEYDVEGLITDDVPAALLAAADACVSGCPTTPSSSGGCSIAPSGRGGDAPLAPLALALLVIGWTVISRRGRPRRARARS